MHVMAILQHAQVSALLWIQSFHNATWDTLAVLLSKLGNYDAYIWLTALVVWIGGTASGLEIGLLAVTAMIFTDISKSLFATKRPIGYAGIRSLFVHSAAGASFPSGHALVATAVYLRLAAMLKNATWPDGRKWFNRCARWLWIVPVLIGVSRLYLGVHWPVDVAGGFVFGFLLYRAARSPWLLRQQNSAFFVVISVLLLIALTIPLVADTLAVLRFVAALFIFSSCFANFEAAVTVRRALLRMTVGVSGMIACTGGMVLWPSLVPIAPIFQGLWVVAAGALFRRFGM